MMDSNVDEAVKQLIDDSKASLNWSLNLDCFILKIIAIPSSKLIWVVGSEDKVFLVDGEGASDGKRERERAGAEKKIVGEEGEGGGKRGGGKGEAWRGSAEQEAALRQAIEDNLQRVTTALRQLSRFGGR